MRHPYLRLLLILLIGLKTISVFATETYFRVQIQLPKDPAARQQLLGKLEVDHYQEINGSFQYVLTEKQYQLLQSLPVTHQLLSRDVQAEYQAANVAYYQAGKNQLNQARVALEQVDQVLENIIRTPSAFQVKPTLGGYYSFAEMESAMDALVAAYPSIAQKFSIGTSVEGRPLWCVKISDNVATDEGGEPELLYTGLVHAREAISGSSMLFFLQYLCENYVNGNPVKALVDNREFYIIPCANPDGWEYNRVTNPNGGGQWRKNRQDNGDGSFGVDLNRNWSADWADCAGAIGAPNCGSAAGVSEVYWGAAPFSEPETNFLKQFIESRQFVACLDQHSVGPYYSLPYGRLTRSLSPQQSAIFTQLTSAMGKYNGMRYGNTYETLGYEVSGAMKDWLLQGGDAGSIASTYSMTAEGGNGSSVLAFWPNAGDIVTLCKGMIYQNLQLAYSAGSYVDIQDISSLSLSSRNGNLSFRVRRIGLGNGPVTVSVVPLSNISAVGAPVQIASLPNFNDTYTGTIGYTIPASVSNGGNIRYAWRVETGGQVYTDTVRSFYNPIQVASDNMEAGSIGTKWTISGGGWAYTTDAAYTGSRSMAESPNNAEYANNVLLTAQFKTTLDLTRSGMALLSFYVKHRAENFRDKLQVQVSTNGSTWVEVPGRTTVEEPGAADGSTLNAKPALTGINEYWTREVYDLSGYVGNKNLRVRLQFSSNGSSAYVHSTDAGFNIDDFVVYKGTSAPAQLVISGKNQSAVNLISWNTDQTDAAMAGSFVVERSVNGVDYEAIGDVEATGAANYRFTDETPFAGENYYRVLVRGAASYHTQPVVLSSDKGRMPTGIVQLFPNPGSGMIQVQFQVAVPNADFIYRVYNSSGQLMLQEKLGLDQGLHTLPIDAAQLAPGEYIFSIAQAGSGTSYERVFIRQ